MELSNDRPNAVAIKNAELLSYAGAFVLGAGLALLAPVALALAPYALWLSFAGIALHAWGMTSKHRLQRSGGTMPGWERALFAVCWFLLLALAAWLAWTGAR